MFENCWESSLADPARKYLNDRKFTDETLRKFRVGFAPASLDDEFSDDDIERLEAWKYVEGRVLKYRDRVMFPIVDVLGRVRGFSGRSVGTTTAIKYYNAAESEMFKKSELLFGLDHARKAIFLNNKVIVCEGFTDVLAFHQHGTPIAVACMGVALTETHVRTLMRYTDTLYFAFDADKGGNVALKKSVDMCKDLGLNYGLYKLPEGKDPASHLLGGQN